MPMSKGTGNNDYVDELWRDVRDSLQHAFHHFFELSTGTTNEWHHQKWLLLTVHHAASRIAFMWLIQAEPHYGRRKSPGLKDITKKLLNYRGTPHLSLAEKNLLIIFKRLNDIRNKFMHEIPPKTIDKAVIAFAVMSMIGIYRATARRMSSTFYDLFEEFPENRKIIVDALHYSHWDEYKRLVETLLHDEFPEHVLEQCPHCGSDTVISNQCEACFEEIQKVICTSCSTEFLIISADPFDQHCPECGCADYA